ncbi:hypothetical protein AB0L80_07550 [Streptomyces sp. NPDC052069]|uniref:hypothetical protein n=1 Tax=Streptomyces sp. NPDC052069 TaxID=3154650 RepID=UPI0034166912
MTAFRYDPDGLDETTLDYIDDLTDDEIRALFDDDPTPVEIVLLAEMRPARDRRAPPTRPTPGPRHPARPRRLPADRKRGPMNTVQIQDGDGGWITIGTMADDGLVLNEPDTDDTKTLALPPISVEIVVDLEALQAALRSATALAAAQLDRRHDRPAWQSPYGPPTRHRR